jgi:hypothetical protein
VIRHNGAVHGPSTSTFGSGNCTGAFPTFSCSFYFFKDFQGQFRPSVAQQLYPYVKNHRVYYDPEDPTGDRFNKGRWSGRYMGSSYMWVAGPSLGNVQCRSQGQPLSFAAVPVAASMQMIQDNWSDMHTQNNPPPRWIIAFADGHAKFAIYVDPTNQCQFQNGPRGGPWAWNHCNPQDPQDVNTALPRKAPYCM